MSKICDIDESGDVLVTYTGNERDGLKVVCRCCPRLLAYILHYSLSLSLCKLVGGCAD